MSIGEIIKQLRKSKKLSQADLAKRIGVSPGNVGDWERGRAKPGADALIALMNFFDVSSDYLLTGQKNTPVQASNGNLMELSDMEREIITKVRSGLHPIFDRDIRRVTGEVGRLTDREHEMILTLRQLDDRDQREIFEVIKLKYELRQRNKGGPSSPLSNGDSGPNEEAAANETA